MTYDRRKRMSDIFLQMTSVSLKELERMFPEVSSMTLRRDLEFLEKKGEILRTKGGAVSLRSLAHPREDVYSMRETQNYENKEKIARVAASMIQPARSIYIDAGTTAMSLARNIADIKISVVTSGPNIALELLKKSGTTVNIIGGLLNRDNLALSGDFALKFVNSINIDMAFLVTSGFSYDSGFTCGNHSECELKQLVIKKARKVIMLMDSSKLDRTMPFTFANLSDIDVLICDSSPDNTIIDASKENNVEVIIAQ